MKYLGETLDIHSGGVDLAFPHHENEIAESEAATGKPFVKYWLHAEHLLVDGQKMSKSLGNFYTLRDLFAKGTKPSSLRLLLASVPYRRQLNFTMESLQQAASSVERLRQFLIRLGEIKGGEKKASEAIVERVRVAEEGFDAGMADDLNTAQALAAVFELVRDTNIAMESGKLGSADAEAMRKAMVGFDEIFALLKDEDAARLHAIGFGQKAEEISEAEIEELIARRLAARKKKNFAESDRIRDELTKQGVILEDTRDGMRWKRR
jgi:cysteinyl-tRNA synthetase